MRQSVFKASPVFLIAISVLSLFFCVTKVAAEELPSEISLSKDRNELDELRKEIPLEKRNLNDERAFLDELFSNVGSQVKASDIQNRFNRNIQRKREEQSKLRDRERKEFSNKQKTSRESFQKNSKQERESFFKKNKDNVAKKEFLETQEMNRKKFYADQKDERDLFESKQKDSRADFNEKIKNTTELFKQRLKAFKEASEQNKKDQKKPLEQRQSVESWKNVEQQFEYIKKKQPVDLNK